MELSPEERRRIYEEERARLEGKQQGVSGTAQSAARESIIVPLVFALVLGVIGYYFYSRFISNSGSQSNQATGTVSNASPQPASTPPNNPSPSATPDKTESPANSLTSKPTPTPGVELHVDYVDKIPVARTEDDFYAIEDAISRNDDITALAMIQKGRVLMIENNTPIVVLEPFGYLTKIKVKKSGRSGWVKSAWIRQETF